MSRDPPRPGRLTSRPPPRLDRVRKIDSAGFAFIPNRFLHDGFFAALTPDERSLYFLLVLAGDRNGVSFYGHDRICSVLETPLDSYLETRNALIAKDLIATDGARIQILSLPERPVFRSSRPLVTREDLEEHDPATIRARMIEALQRLGDD